MWSATEIINTTANIATDIVIIGGSAWAFRKWRQRPQLLVGVPPRDTEMEDKKIGRKGIPRKNRGRGSYSDRFRFDETCLAVSDRFSLLNLFKRDYLVINGRFHLWKAWLALERRFNYKPMEVFDKERKAYEWLLSLDRESGYKKRCRIIPLVMGDSKDGRVEATLPLIVANNGHRAALDYILGVDFRGGDVHVVDIYTETLKVDSLYVTKTGLVNDHIKRIIEKDAKDKIADDRILAAYRSLGIEMEGGGDSDIFFVSGNLERGVYETILITLQIDSGAENQIDSVTKKPTKKVENFVLVYKVDCSDWCVSTQTLFQGFKVEWK